MRNDDVLSSCKPKKIVLALMPFWAPLTPPLGISCLKSFLSRHGYNIKTVDFNIVPELWGFHNKYLICMDGLIPEDKKGNLHMVAYDIYMNHLMVHINCNNQDKYIEAVKVLVSKNFFTDISDNDTYELIKIVKEFYEKLEEFLIKLFEKEKPEIFGVSVYNSTLAPSMFALRLAKQKIPGVTTVMGGGVFADQLSVNSPDFKVFLEMNPQIDKIIIGEGELIFLKLLRGELPENQQVYTLDDVEKQYVDLSTVDIPDFSDFNIEAYPHLAAFASRSCPFQCSFCSETVQWGMYRKKTAAQISDELVRLNTKYNYQLFLLGDSLINPVVTELANELINKDLSIYWDAYIRADKPVCDLENTLLWRKAGFYRARLGIESGSQNVLNLMNKKTTPKQIKEALTALAYAGIKTTTYWVIGHPGETEDDFLETLGLVEEMRDFIYEADWHPFFYYPRGQVSSENWEQENGLSLLYPEEMKEYLVTQTWVLNSNPSRAEIYRRVCRFGEHCKKLGIPNPYSLKDIHEADQRWKLLQKNAVPSLSEFRSAHNIDENKRVKKYVASVEVFVDDGDFSF